MAKDDALSLLTSEFKLWGVEFSHRTRGNSHIELRWRVSSVKDVRSYIIAKTPSDHRGWLNARADIRRLFKADGLTLKEPEKKPKPTSLQKALSLPEVIETDSDQIRVLRSELAELTDLVLDMSNTITLLRDKLLLSDTQEQKPEPVVVELKRSSVRAIKVLEHLCDGWNTTEALAGSMGLTPRITYRKLYYELQKGNVELSGGRWRRTPKLQLAKG